MCGVIGFLNTKSVFDLSILSHRGPDSSGLFEDDGIYLGHTRLAIQDVTVASNQPFYSPDGRYVIVFNGEIYNHREIRKDLVSLGISFRTNGDTETILHALINYGPEAIKRFNGIFAFGFYDCKERRLLLSRDRYGVKPLYYGIKNATLVFSSELKALKSWEYFNDSLDLNSLENYIRFLWSPGEGTPIKSVKKFSPGSYMEYFLDTHSVKQLSYLDEELPLQYPHNEDQLINELCEHIEIALKRQLLSDVPVGFFLSGGLDSSLLVAMARKIMPKGKIQCFTIDTSDFSASAGFENDLFYAKKVARYLNVDLKIVRVDNDVLEDFDRMIWILDEPQADAAPLNVYNISKAARAMGYKVLIGGTAGDDLFSGYRRHKALNYIKRTRFLPSLGFRIARFMVQFIPLSEVKKRRVLKILRGLSETNIERIYSLFEWIPFSISSKLFAKASLQKNRFETFEKVLGKKSLKSFTLEDFLFLEKKFFLCDHNLNYTDKMGMAAGVEIRVPYLDNDLESFARTIPEHFKIRDGEVKYILKKVAEKYLPDEIIYRPKSGFGAPVRKWILEDLSQRVDKDLSEQKLREQGIFDPKAVRTLINNNRKAKEDSSYSIWALLAVQSWIKQFVTDVPDNTKLK